MFHAILSGLPIEALLLIGLASPGAVFGTVAIVSHILSNKR